MFFKNLRLLTKIPKRLGSHGKDWANHELELSDKPIIKLSLSNKET